MMGANYGRRKEDIGIDMIPRWLHITMIICKGLLILGPFTISSIAMFLFSKEGVFTSDMYYTAGLWNCVWMISLLQIINFASEK